MITVTTDPSRKLIRTHMAGFLDVSDVAAFSRDEQAAITAMGLKSGEFLLLVETSECMIQSQAVVAAFQDIILNSPCKARRIAIVREGSMSRLQTNRIVAIREDAAVFRTCAEAETWLFADVRGTA